MGKIEALEMEPKKICELDIKAPQLPIATLNLWEELILILVFK